MLPVLPGVASPPESGPADDCCEACAATRVAAHVDVPQHALIATPATRRGPLPIFEPPDQLRVGISRSDDRRIAFGGLAISGAYLAAAGLSLFLPPPNRLGTWLPAHLALAGAVTTAIAALLPFFTAALAIAPPARPAVRIGGIALVALGALAAMVAYGQAAGQAAPATLAGGTFLAGLGLVGMAAFVPIRGALGPRRPIVERAYALALANVAVGVTIATLFVGGNLAVETAWGALKPAHAWLNLVGFAGLVIVATLLHLAPTVAGARLRSRTSGRLAVVGLALGAPVVAAGYIMGMDVVARTGAIVVLASALGTAAHGAAVQFDRGRGPWTTDPGWHRLATVALFAGQGWLGLGLAIAASRVLIFGAAPVGWSLVLIVGPLVVGGVAQILVGAMTHLLPTIGPGDPVRHAKQRRLMGRGATVRLVLLNAGAAFVTLGFGPMAALDAGAARDTLVGLGLGCAALAMGASLVLFAAAARRGPVVRYVDYGTLPAGRV